MRKLRKALATFLSFLMCFSLFANVAHAEEPVFIDSSNDAIVSEEDIVSEDEYSEDIDVISDENVDDLDIEEIADEASELSEDDTLSEDDLETIETSEDNNIAENSNSAISEDIIDEALYEEVISENDIDIIEEPETPEPAEIETIIVEQEPIVYEDNVLMSDLDDAIEINETNFPDPVFRQYVLDNLDNNIADGYLDETEIINAEIINVSYYNLSSLVGIEAFANLKELLCSNCNLSFINVSSNTLLEKLCCDWNHLESIDVSNNSNLYWLDCSYNYSIEELDVSNNTNLKYLMCGNNELNYLDIHNNILLEQLMCSNNLLTEINVDSNTSLKSFECSNNQLDSINISNNASLVNFECYGNYNIDSLNVCNNPNLSILRFGNNNISYINLSNNPNLTELDCSSNNISSLDLSNNPNLIGINCSYNSISELEVGNLSELTSLYVNGNNLSLLDISNNEKLTLLYCSSNQLESLEVSNNLLLENLICSNNNLSSLDVSNNSELKELVCGNNNISELNISNCPNLIECMNYEQSFYDSIIRYEFYNDYFYALEVDLKTNLTPQHPNVLIVVSIDEEHFPDEEFRNCIKSYDVDNDENLSSLEIASVINLNINDKNINNLDGIEYLTELSTLNCENNNLTILDLSNNTKLYSLICAGNDLTILDLSNNVELNYLNCVNNCLSSLILPQTEKLTNISCSNNNLDSIDVSYSPNIYYLECYNNNISELDITNCECLLAALHGTLDIQNGILYFVDDINWYYLYLDNFTNIIPDIYSGEIIATIDQDHFPDENFRNYLSNYDLNNDMSLNEAEIASVKNINISNQSCDSLEGIGYFYNLESLICDNNNIDSLDLSSNTKLIKLECNNNQLTTLDLSNNASLEYLNCYGNSINNLDVSKCSSLYHLDCQSNDLESIDISNNTKLIVLWCHSNHLTSINLQSNINLKDLSCSSNLLEDLDISFNKQLEYLLCYNNKLSSLDISENLYLSYLDCCENNISELNITNCRDLILAANSSVDFEYGKIVCFDTDTYSYLRIDDYTNLIPSLSMGDVVVAIDEEHFPDEAFRNYVSSLDFNNDGFFSEVEIAATKILEIWDDYSIESIEGIQYFTNLTDLSIYNSNISSIDLSANIELIRLRCSSTKLNNLDVSNNTKLTYLDCNYNKLTFLNLGNNCNLTYLNCQGNSLAFLNLSNVSMLSRAYINGSKYDEYDYDSYIYDYYIDEMSYVSIVLNIDKSVAIIVDESIILGGNNIVELNQENFTDNYFRIYLSKYDYNKDGWLSDKEISFIKSIIWSEYYFGTVSSFEGIEYLTSLEKLSCKNINSLISLDISQNVNLKYLDCSGCGLSLLDISNNVDLEYLNCDLTNIKKLDISRCEKLLSVVDEYDSTYSIYSSGRCYGTGDIQLIVNSNTLLLYPGSGSDEIIAEIDEQTFPDQYFREYVSNFDLDSDGKFSEAEINAVNSISLSHKVIYTGSDILGLESLEGIEIFTELKSLTIEHNYILNYLDLSNNSKLEYLNCTYSNIPSLDVSNNLELNTLICAGCQSETFTNLNLINNKKLRYLNCKYCTYLTSLDISQNPNLQHLDCMYTSLESVDISCCDKLVGIVPDYYRLAFKCFIGNSAELYVDENTLIIYPTGSIKICDIVVSPSYEQAYNFVKHIYTNILNREPSENELSSCINKLMNNEIKGVDLPYELLTGEEFLNKNISNEEYVSILFFTFFTRIPDSEGATYWISRLESGENSREYTISGFANSQEFTILCSSYNIESGRLNIQNLKTISFLPGEGDLLGTGEMDSITINSGELYVLPGCDFTAPEGYKFDKWMILSGNCDPVYKYEGETYNIFYNTVIKAVWTDINDNIEINDENFPDTNFRERYITKCDLNSDGYLSAFEISNVQSLELTYEYYFYDGTSISTLKGIEYFTSLKTLSVMGNSKLSYFDISKNTQLESLTYSHNSNLSSIDLSKNTELKSLTIKGNSFDYLDLSNNTKLKFLDCRGISGIESLDISYCEDLVKLVPDYYNLNEHAFKNVDAGLYVNDDLLIIYPTGTIRICDIIVAPNYTKSEAFVSRLYSIILNRNVSESELSYYISKLMSCEIKGSDLLYELLSSNEFINRNTSNSEFVSILYLSCFGRYPDSGGLEYWVDLLDRGLQSREYVIINFIRSSEFIYNCGNYNIEAGSLYTLNIKPGNGELIGTGNIETQYVPANKIYVLPSCEFIPPEGYEFDKWEFWPYESDSLFLNVGDEITIKTDSTITAVWKARNDIAYVVEHYKQDYDGEYNSEPEIENLTGTTGTTVTPNTKSYVGFASPDAESVVIKGDGTTKVTYYYTRKSYNLTWDYNGGTASGDYTIGSLKYETPIVAPSLTRTGYTFAGWDMDIPDTMPSNDITIKALWNANTNIAYVVKHYKQDLDGEYNSAPEVQNFTGTADATVKPAVNDYEGFKKPSVKTVTIKADGSLVVKYYYKRNSYTLTWDLKGGTASGDYTTGSTKYESPITAPTPTRVGYTFNGWNVSVPSNMPASDTTIEAKWKAKTDTVYKVEHYKQGLDGKYTAKPTIEKFTGKTGASVTPEVKKYSGFKSPEVKTVKIKADGSLVLKYYYTRNKYTLKWDYAGGNASGTFTSGKIMYGTKITAPKPTRKGYTFNGWSATVSKTMPAKNLTYKAKWKINSYTLTWNLNGGTASNKYTSGKIKYNTKITAPIPTKEGYVFDGWSVSVPSKMPAKNLKITAKWRERTQEELVTDFVKRFYSEVLQRSQADIDADAAGINSWVNKLVSGQEDGANVAYGFVYSAEFQNKKVSDEEYVLILYHAFFGRDPFDPNNYDAGGYNNWVKKLKNGTDRMDVLAGFINSAEFENLCKKYNIKRGKLVPSEKPAYRKAHNLP